MTYEKHNSKSVTVIIQTKMHGTAIIIKSIHQSLSRQLMQMV